MRMALVSLMAIISALCLPRQALSGTLMVHTGPVAYGGGGPNPISIPPSSPLDFGVTWLTDAQTEWRVSLSPGFFYGMRTKTKNYYGSMGYGLVIDQNGGSPGIYGALGYAGDCQNYCFTAEYQKALGFYSGHLLSPYAVRIGMGIKF